MKLLNLDALKKMLFIQELQRVENSGNSILWHRKLFGTINIPSRFNIKLNSKYQSTNGFTGPSESDMPSINTQ